MPGKSYRDKKLLLQSHTLLIRSSKNAIWYSWTQNETAFIDKNYVGTNEASLTFLKH